MAEKDGIPWGSMVKGAVEGFLKGIADWFRGRKPVATTDGKPAAEGTNPRGLLIIGPGGVGKTTLARMLSGEFDWLSDDPWRYAGSVTVEEYALADDPTVEVIAAPGQDHRRDTWPELLTAIRVGLFRGVIFVSSNGYGVPQPLETRAHALFAGSLPDFRAALPDHQRAEELRTLGIVLNALAACPERVWLLSVVTKQDVWGSASAKVERDHHTGAMGQAVEKWLSGGGHRRHEWVFVSLVIRNVETRSGEHLYPNQAGYDQCRQAASLRHLFDIVYALAQEEQT